VLVPGAGCVRRNDIEAGDAEIIADDISTNVLASLSGGVPARYPQFG
jgi:hypothetical protein